MEWIKSSAVGEEDRQSAPAMTLDGLPAGRQVRFLESGCRENGNGVAPGGRKDHPGLSPEDGPLRLSLSQSFI